MLTTSSLTNKWKAPMEEAAESGLTETPPFLSSFFLSESNNRTPASHHHDSALSSVWNNTTTFPDKQKLRKRDEDEDFSDMGLAALPSFWTPILKDVLGPKFPHQSPLSLSFVFLLLFFWFWVFFFLLSYDDDSSTFQS